eukprot:3252918-Alexandrium_andersonii.AAC.1
MSASLVGSEMCIRDRLSAFPLSSQGAPRGGHCRRSSARELAIKHLHSTCLLYTSDAADDM